MPAGRRQFLHRLNRLVRDQQAGTDAVADVLPALRNVTASTELLPAELVGAGSNLETAAKRNF